jgi:hypothetical protein
MGEMDIHCRSIYGINYKGIAQTIYVGAPSGNTTVYVDSIFSTINCRITVG